MWRTGRKVGRTIYRQLGPEPSDADPLIGVMDSAEDAATVVRAVNGETSEMIGAALSLLDSWQLMGYVDSTALAAMQHALGCITGEEIRGGTPCRTVHRRRTVMTHGLRSPKAQPPDRSCERACLGKRAYEVWQDAEDECIRLRRAHDSTVFAYRCNFCKLWHIGHAAFSIAPAPRGPWKKYGRR